jgi:hypothetical protein
MGRDELLALLADAMQSPSDGPKGEGGNVALRKEHKL